MKNKQIKIGAVISYIAIIVNILAGLIYTPWMISKIGQSQYGLYTLANSLITLFLVDFGLSSATARYISNYRAKNQDTEISSFLGAIYKLYGIIDIIFFFVFAFLYIFLDKIYVGLTVNELKQFRIVFLIIAVYNLINFPFVTLNGILTSYEKFIQLKLADLLYKVLVVVFSVGVLLLGGGLYGLVSSTAIVGGLTIIYKIILVKTKINVRINFRKTDFKIYKSIFSFSLWVTIASLAQRLIFNITPTILGVVSSSSAIAVFGVVTSIEGYVYTISTAINGMFMPTVSKIYTEDAAEEKMMPLLIKVGRFQFALNALIIIGWILMGRQFIDLWVGPSYDMAYLSILLVIFPGLFFNSLQISNTAMIVQNKVKFQAIVSMICGIINVIFSFILSSKWGALGASVSICIAYFLRAIIYNVATQKIMKFNMIQFIKQCYLKMGIPFLTTLCIGGLVNYFWGGNGWIILAIKALIISIIYVVFIFFLGLNKEERKRILQKLKKQA